MFSIAFLFKEIFDIFGMTNDCKVVILVFGDPLLKFFKYLRKLICIVSYLISNASEIRTFLTNFGQLGRFDVFLKIVLDFTLADHNTRELDDLVRCVSPVGFEIDDEIVAIEVRN